MEGLLCIEFFVILQPPLDPVQRASTRVGVAAQTMEKYVQVCEPHCRKCGSKFRRFEPLFPDLHLQEDQKKSPRMIQFSVEVLRYSLVSNSIDCKRRPCT